MSPGVSVGDRAPGFKLPDAGSGEVHRFEEGRGRPAVVVWTCNHCPYALAWHDRLVEVANDYDDVDFFFVNSNDGERYPADSLEAMQRRVSEEDWPAPYLHDSSQDAAREWGAEKTPDVFVVDGEGIVRYRGAPDSDHMDPSLGAAWLREALDDVLAGGDLRRRETDPVGCSIKWRQ